MTLTATRNTSDRLASVLEAVRELGPTLRKRAPAAERTGRHSDETIADLDATGAFEIATPAEFGGAELSVRQQLDVVAEVSKWDGSAGWTVWAGASINWIPAGMGRRVLDEVFGSEWVGPRMAGSSHFPASRGRARKVDGGWLVSGGPWTFATGARWTPYTNLGWSFATMAGMSIGLAQGALERFLERSAGRPLRGTTYTDQLAAPLTHLMLAEVHSKIQSAVLMTQANADETDRLGELAAAGSSADPKYLQLFSARVLVETAYAMKWCAEAIELLQRNSGSTAIMDFEPIQRSWRDARVITLHGALNLEALSENYGRLLAGIEPHKVAGITSLDRFAPAVS